MSEATIPVPVPDERSAGYWSAAAQGVLAIQCCDHCGRLAMPPDIVCVGCRSPEPSFHDQPVSGRGAVRSWTVMRTAFLPGFASLVPYTLVDVELDEQEDLRVVGRLLHGAPSELIIGARVETVFEEIVPGCHVPGFALSEAT